MSKTFRPWLVDQLQLFPASSRDGFVQACNAQAAVDTKAHVIVAHGLSNCAADSGQLVPMIDAVIANTGTKPTQMSSESGHVHDIVEPAGAQRSTKPA